ncbi:MAG: YlxR family protein [Candidatus Gastranaerophilaceae bacterium]|jgi:hypothetical protein
MKNNSDKKNITEKDVKVLSFTSFSQIPQRKCAGCNKTAPRNLFIKILKCHKTKQLILQPDNKQFGRSIYFCSDINCFNQILKKKRIQKVLKAELTEEFSEKIKNLISKRLMI